MLTLLRRPGTNQAFMSDPNDPRTPGQLIQALLAERGWTQRVLALVIGADETGINHIIAGKRPVKAELALVLAEVFEVPAERFLDLQNAYDLAQARLVARPDPRRATRARIFGGLPITEMIKRGWLDVSSVRDVPRVEGELAKFFGVPSVEEIEILPHAAKKTNVAESATPAQLAWLHRVKTIASEMMVARYSPRALQSALPKLSELLASVEETRKVPRILAEAGVRFVLVESLPGAKIDGACFWKDENSPIIGMSLRFDRIDNFWFVLRHEIEHVLRGHGRDAVIIDAELEGERAGSGDGVADEERVANAAAAEFCVPQAALERFVKRKAPFFAERDIIGFARTLQVHPGLIAGQLQRRTGRYERFRNHQVKVRAHVAPGSIVDGWGDVALVDM
jgi:HTH-type transcriptional regulator / antitoxin HigA